MLGFLEALEGWGIPLTIIIGLAFIFIITQVVGAIVDACGKTAPAFFNLIKWIKKRRENKKNSCDNIEMIELLKEVKAQQEDIKNQQKEVKIFLEEVKGHYGKDNIAQRDKWMLEVNSTMHWAKERAKVYDASVNELKELTDIVKTQTAALDLNNKMTSDLYKQSARGDILDFAHKLVNARKADKPVIFSREEFRKIRKTYDAYEEFLQTYGGTNGEVEDAIEIIRRAERLELPNIEFLEELRD